jgi:hypothetical protein
MYRETFPKSIVLNKNNAWQYSLPENENAARDLFARRPEEPTFSYICMPSYDELEPETAKATHRIR